jgi:hypothetical protein
VRLHHLRRPQGPSTDSSESLGLSTAACPSAPAPKEVTGALHAHYRDATQASHQATTTIGRAACATDAPSQILATVREATITTGPDSHARDRRDEATHRGQDKAGDIAGPLQYALLSLGITSPALLARGTDLDQASWRLLIEAADEPSSAHSRPSAIPLN